MKLKEIIGCLPLVAMTVGSSWFFGATFGRWGYLWGIPIGWALFVAVMLLYVLAWGFVDDLRRRLPRCRNGCCRARDYQRAPDSRGREIVCRCGDHYKVSGDRMFYIDAERWVRPYMVRVGFGKWKPATACGD